MGTPPYMAPEQARGENKELDARCDVFGLGAILCEILTGEPAIRGASGLDILLQSADGNLDDAMQRLDQCTANADLIELAKKCLAPVNGERLSGGGAVAESVAAYQQSVQEKLRQAELEKAQAEVQAVEERKRREVEEAKTKEERRQRAGAIVPRASVKGPTPI